MPFNRRDFLKISAAGLAAAGFPRAIRASRHQGTMTFYLGTYTQGESEGIYRCAFDSETGAVEIRGSTSGIANPSFLSADAENRRLFAVSETGDGEVFAYRIEPETGNLEFINKKSSHGGAPCYITTDRAGRNVLVANYGGGNVAVLPVRSDGKLADASDVVQHEGSGGDPRRQQGPHAHSIVLDPANRFAFAVDLGIDAVLVYAYDAERGTLTPVDSVALAPAAGPRHFAFHPDGTRAYVINELDSTLTAFSYDAPHGRLTEIQTLSTLPEGHDGESYCADVHVAPSGRFVYGSNRGHNSIVVFAVDEGSGRLSPVQYQSTLGDWPRNFAIDPSGRYLLAANQRSDDVFVFAIDPESGMLEPTGHVLQVPSPVCVRFVSV